MNNLEFFNICKQYPEPLFDPYYAKSCLVIPQNAEEENRLTRNSNKLLAYVTTFCVLRFEQQKDLSDDAVRRVVDSVIDILDTTENINYTPFSQFFMVYNASYSLYMELTREEKCAFIYEMLERYGTERHGMYLSHGYSNIVMQVMSDNYSHKRKSKAGIEKVIDLLSPYTMRRISQYSDIADADDIYFLPDKGDSLFFERFLRDYRIAMQSRNIEQNKMPDLVFKHAGHFYICELKSMKGKGGGQNKQIVEVAYFIRFSEEDERIHYITFLDSQYANELMNGMTPKLVSQRHDIERALQENPGNYFVNTAGFQKLLEQIFA